MIKFRQKEYVLPAALLTVGKGALGALNAAGNVAAIGGIAQGAQQMKQAEEQAEEQAAQNRKITKALNNIAENAKNNPQAAQQAADVISQKQFAKIKLGSLANNKTVKNAIGLGKDVGKIAWKNRRDLAGGLLAGAALSGASYITDKAIQYDMKKSGIPLPPKKEQREYSLNKESIMKGIKFAGRELKQTAKNNKKMIGSMALLGSAPTALGYIAEKKEIKDQINSTVPPAKERTYSFKSSVISSFGKLKNKIAAAPIFHNTGEKILGGISSISGGGGRKGVYKFGHQLNRYGKHSGSEWSQKAGKFIMDHPKTALVGSIPVGVGIMAATWDTGEKLVRKGMKKLDKNAYAYQESKEEEIPE